MKGFVLAGLLLSSLFSFSCFSGIGNIDRETKKKAAEIEKQVQEEFEKREKQEKERGLFVRPSDIQEIIAQKRAETIKEIKENYYLIPVGRNLLRRKPFLAGGFFIIDEYYKDGTKIRRLYKRKVQESGKQVLEESGNFYYENNKFSHYVPGGFLYNSLPIDNIPNVSK